MQKLSIDKFINYRKKDFRDPHYYYSNILNYGKVTEDNRIDLSTVKEKYRTDGAPLDVCLALMSEFLQSKWSLNIFKSERLYRTKKFKNYIPSRPLLDLLSRMKVDMPVDNIPSDYKAYFELSGYEDIGYIIVNMDTYEEGPVLRITLSDYSRKTEGYYLGIQCNPGENVLETMQRMGYYEYDLGTHSHVEITIPDKVKFMAQLALNLIIYTTSPNQEFIEQFNQFSPKNKIAQEQKKTYTIKPYVPIGFDAEFLRLITVETGTVMPFPRWQPCGPERKQRKLIIVRGHERKYKKHINS